MKKSILLILIYTQIIGCSVVKNNSRHDPCNESIFTTKTDYKTIINTKSDSNNLEYTIFSYQDSTIIQNPLIWVIKTNSNDTVLTLNKGYSKLNLKDGKYNLLISKDNFTKLEITQIPISGDSIVLINVLLGPDCNHIIDKLDLRTW